MKQRYYSVYDNVSKTYAPFFRASNDEDAKRIFERMIAETEKKDPFFECEDVDLWFIAQFDDEKLVVSGEGLGEIAVGEDYVPTDDDEDHAVVEKENKK